MTNTSKPIKRETFSSLRLKNRVRAIVIELHPTHIVVRLKGTRRSCYSITYDAVFMAAAKLEADARRREKLASRSRRGKGAA